jgi:hypothetical protein
VTVRGGAANAAVARNIAASGMKQRIELPFS